MLDVAVESRAGLQLNCHSTPSVTECRAPPMSTAREFETEDFCNNGAWVLIPSRRQSRTVRGRCPVSHRKQSVHSLYAPIATGSDLFVADRKRTSLPARWVQRPPSSLEGVSIGAILPNRGVRIFHWCCGRRSPGRPAARHCRYSVGRPGSVVLS